MVYNLNLKSYCPFSRRDNMRGQYVPIVLFRLSLLLPWFSYRQLGMSKGMGNMKGWWTLRLQKEQSSSILMKVLNKSMAFLVSRLPWVLSWFVGIEVHFLLHICSLPAETVVHLLWWEHLFSWAETINSFLQRSPKIHQVVMTLSYYWCGLDMTSDLEEEGSLTHYQSPRAIESPTFRSSFCFYSSHRLIFLLLCLMWSSFFSYISAFDFRDSMADKHPQRFSFWCIRN